MAEENKNNIYGKNQTTADVVPFEKYTDQSGGFKIEGVDTDSGKVAYKYYPPKETVTGVTTTDVFNMVQQGQPVWETVKHVDVNPDVPIYLDDGVTPNPDKIYRTVIKDRLGNHVLFKGTREQNRKRAETWDFTLADLQQSDYPIMELKTYGPASDDPNDVGQPFVPSERDRDSKKNPMDYRIGPFKGSTADQVAVGPFDIAEGQISFPLTRGDIRGYELATGKYRIQENQYFPSLINRFAQDFTGMFVDTLNILALGLSNTPKAVGHVVETIEAGFAETYGLAGKAVSSKVMFDQTEAARELRAQNEYFISQYLFKATEWTNENLYARMPTSYSIFAKSFGQPTQEEIDKGIAAWKEQDLRTFFENPNQSAIGKIAVELGVGYGFMKGINFALRTVPKGINTYTHYIQQGKKQFFKDLDDDRVRALSQGDNTRALNIPRTTKEKEKAWNELSKIQQDSYGKKALSDKIAEIAAEEGTSWFGKESRLGRSYRIFVENMRFENGRKILSPAPNISVRNPKNIFRSEAQKNKLGKDEFIRVKGLNYREGSKEWNKLSPTEKNRFVVDATTKKVQPFDNYFASEEFHANTSASIGAVWLGNVFHNAGLPGGETAGYLLGAVSFAFGGTAMYNRRFWVQPTDIAVTAMAGGVPLSYLVRMGVTKPEVDHLDTVKYTYVDDDGVETVRNLNPYEKRQINHVVDAIKAMAPERQANVLNGMDAYQNLIQKLVAQGGDEARLGLKIAQVADLAAVRAIQADLVEKINLGVGVNLNIKELTKQLDEEAAFLKEISDLTKRVLKTKTIDALGKETQEALLNMDNYYTRELRDLNEQYNELSQVNDIFRSLGDASQYKNQGPRESFDEVFQRSSISAKLSVLKVLKLDNVDVNSPEAPAKIRAVYDDFVKEQNETFDKWTNDMISEFKVSEADRVTEASDWVGGYERRRGKLKQAGDRLYAPIIAKLDDAGTMNITNWVDNFALAGDSLFTLSKKPANIIINERLPKDFQYLVTQILGEDMADQVDSLIYSIAKEADDTPNNIKRAILDEYGIDPADGLEFYKWVKAGGEDVDNFKEAYKDSGINFDELYVSAQSVVNIRRKLKGHQEALKRKIDNAPVAASVTQEQNSLNILNAFEEQFDVLFNNSYGDNASALLQEYKGVSTQWGAVYAPLLHNDFSFEFGRYGRSLSKGETGEYGSNRVYGSKGVGMNPIEWGDELMKRIKEGDAAGVARYLNETFGQKILTKEGNTIYRIVDPTEQKFVAKQLESMFERETNKLGSNYFKNLQLKTERGLDNLQSEVWDMVDNGRVLQHHMMVPDGASYKLVTSESSRPRTLLTKRAYIFDNSSSSSFQKDMMKKIKDSPESKNILRSAATVWKRAELEVMTNINNIKLDIDEKTKTLETFFKGQGISYKPGSFNIKKAFKHFTEESTGSVERIREYKKYFFAANKQSKKPLPDKELQKAWQEHIRSIITRGFLDNHTQQIPGSGTWKKVPNESTTYDAQSLSDQWIKEPDIQLKPDAGNALRDYEDVFIEAMGEDHFRDLQDIISFVDLSQQGYTSMALGKTANIPTDMELRAVMSRVYGVVRQVVSKHWVATEFLIHSTRGQKGSLLGKLLKSPEIASFVADSINRPQLITEKRVVRINALMPKIFHEVAVEDATYTNNPNYYDDVEFIDESGQPIKRGTLVPKQGVYGDVPTMNKGGNVSLNQQMNRLNFQ